ncbi:modin [Botrytis cinerea]
MSTLDNLNQNVFGLVALIVAVIALLTTCLQVAQQYFSSAEGYRRCAESVMGLWSGGTHRQLRIREFRVEVVFEVPVIFVAPPSNQRGPIMNRPIHYIDGTPESYKNTKVRQPDDQKKKDRETIQRIHTADDERASWVTLLSSLQTEELKSREWDNATRLKKPTGDLIKSPEYELAVGVQVKTRSWDFVPASMTKPYATSAICHLVEMMAFLGMYWKVFDQILWNLRAEGNGFILTSTTVHGLGVMVVFTVTGQSEFKQDRVIPSNDVKALCFGTVPNIFEEREYLEKVDTESQSLELKFGSQDDVDMTLESLGCKPLILERYRKDHRHIFSVSFEIIGMLGKVTRIRGSNFKMIPNPTQDPWLKKAGSKPAWKVSKLMTIFQEKLSNISKQESDIDEISKLHPIDKIIKKWQDIQSLNYGKEIDEYNLSIEIREMIHDAIDDQTEYLLHDLRQKDVLQVVVAHLDKVTEILAQPKSSLNSIVSAQKEEPLLNEYFDKILPAVSAPIGEKLSRSEEEKRTIIWISLMFRMLCWLLLHDWNKDDRCGVPPDLKGSRMPVFYWMMLEWTIGRDG